MFGCFDTSSNEQVDNKDEKTFFVGSITSSDLNYIDIDREFTYLHQISDIDFREMFFKIYDVDLPEDLSELHSVIAAWGLVFRSDSSFLGVHSAEDLEVKLFQSHFEDRSTPSDVLNGSYYNDVAAITYLGISGWISIEADGKGEYEIQFQKIVDIESEETSGPIVTVSGRIDLEPDNVSF
jgi:hypothetical protein